MTRLATWGVALVAAVAAATGCEQLGNPPRQEGSTPPVVWQGPVADLTTRTETVPASRFEEAVQALPRGAIHHLERPDGGVVTLVVVEPRWRRPVRAGTVPLVTELQLADGTVVRRRWAAPASAPVWYALLALESVPTHAATALAGR